MFVRLKYNDMGQERGYTVQVRNKKELLQKMARLNITPDNIIYFGVKQYGEDQYKEYDPETLKAG